MRIMKRIFTLLTFLSLSFSLFARPAIDDVSPVFKEHVREVLKQYIEVKSALVTADIKEIKTSTNRMIKIVRTFDVTQLTPEEKTFYESQAAVLITEAIAMENEQEVDAQREHFKNVSTAVVELVKGNNYEAKVAQGTAKVSESTTANNETVAAKSVSRTIPAPIVTEKTKPSDSGKVVGTDGERKIRLCYCPIAKAYWLSYEDEANHNHNPYQRRKAAKAAKE